MKACVLTVTTIIAVFALDSCVGVSMHTMHKMRVDIKTSGSRELVKNLPVSVMYSYDSYGLFYFANKPADISTRTDQKGSAFLSIADFRYGTTMFIGKEKEGLSLDRPIGRTGGKFNLPVKDPKFQVLLTPQ